MKAMLPYIVPYFVFVFIGSLSKYFGEYGFLMYPVKTIITAGLIIYWWKSYKEIKLSFSFLSIIIGIVVFFLWIGLTEYNPIAKFRPPANGYNPFKDNVFLSIFLIAFRLGGAVMVVAIFEELFIRSFVIRYLINPNDFQSVRVGIFTMVSFIGSIIIFTIGHQSWEWPAAIVTAIIYNLVLYRRKNIFDCIVAHATTNLCLGIYVLTTGKFGYW